MYGVCGGQIGKMDRYWVEGENSVVDVGGVGRDWVEDEKSEEGDGG